MHPTEICLFKRSDSHFERPTLPFLNSPFPLAGANPLTFPKIPLCFTIVVGETFFLFPLGFHDLFETMFPEFFTFLEAIQPVPLIPNARPLTLTSPPSFVYLHPNLFTLLGPNDPLLFVMKKNPSSNVGGLTLSPGNLLSSPSPIVHPRND